MAKIKKTIRKTKFMMNRAEHFIYAVGVKLF